ncbi:putative DNA helicase ino80 [Tilletia horrida]|uniref:Chromatin-remodeling ATPase INO80 n=1 Tax=Tilletia horrida TaxID=155126 RepID=A0AAN6JLX8_9BASI|nr:putative DNA helicase ino80 [Tilletia horrida]
MHPSHSRHPSSSAYPPEEYEYEYEYSRSSRKPDEMDEAHPATISPHAAHAHAYPGTYPSRPSSTAPPVPLARGAPVPNTFTPGTGPPPPGSASNTPSPRIQPSYFRGGGSGGGGPLVNSNSNSGSAKMAAPAGAAYGSPPRLPPSDSPRHAASLAPLPSLASHRGGPYTAGGPGVGLPPIAPGVESNGDVGLGKSSMSIMNMLNSNSAAAAAAAEAAAAANSAPTPSGSASSRDRELASSHAMRGPGLREYATDDRDGRYRERTASGYGEYEYEYEYEAAGGPHRRMVEDERPSYVDTSSSSSSSARFRHRAPEDVPHLPPPSASASGQQHHHHHHRHAHHHHPSASPASGSVVAATAAAAHHQMREDVAAAALLSVAGGPRIDLPSAPTAPLHPPSRSATTTVLPPPPRVPSIATSTSAAGAGPSARAVGPIPSSRTTSVEPGSSPVTSSAPALSGPTPTTTTTGAGKKTLKLKSKPVPSSAAKTNYAVAPPPPPPPPSARVSTTPTGEGVGAPASKAGGKRSRGGAKVKEEPESGSLPPVGASSSSSSASRTAAAAAVAAAAAQGWDSDLDTEPNAAQWTSALERFQASLAVRRAFLSDASEEHARVRSGASWERLSGAYGKRLAFVEEAARRRLGGLGVAGESEDEEMEDVAAGGKDGPSAAAAAKDGAKKAVGASGASAAAAASSAGKKKGKGTSAGRGGPKNAADEDVTAALLSTLGGGDDDDDDVDEDDDGADEDDGPGGGENGDDVDLLLAEAAGDTGLLPKTPASKKSKKAAAGANERSPSARAPGAAADSASKDGSSTGTGATGAAAGAGPNSAKKVKAPRKSRSKAAVAAEKAAREARAHALANGLPPPPTPPPVAAQARDLSRSKARKSAAAAAAAGSGSPARASVPPPSSPLAGSIAGLDESLANELLSTAVGGDGLGSDADEEEEEEEERRRRARARQRRRRDENVDELDDEDEDEDEEDEEGGSDEEPAAQLAAKRKRLAAAIMSAGAKGKGKASSSALTAVATAASSSHNGSKASAAAAAGKKRKREIDVHDLSGSASRAGSAAIAAALAAEGPGHHGSGGAGSRMHTPLRAMSMSLDHFAGRASPSVDFDDDDESSSDGSSDGDTDSREGGEEDDGEDEADEGEGEREMLAAGEPEEEEEEELEEEEENVFVNPNKPLGVNSAASHPLWNRQTGLVALEPMRIQKLDEAHRKVWTNIARRDIPKVYRTSQASYNNKMQYWKRISMMAQREGKKGNQRNQKTVKDVQARARRVVREMLTFWKKNEKEERELRKRAEKEAMDRAKKEEEMREAKRQARKLNFLITQTELYSHFVGSKLKTSEAEESEETSGGAAAGTVGPSGSAAPVPASAAASGGPGPSSAAVVTASTSKDVPLGPVDGATLNEIDFDDEDESNLRAHAARNAQQAVEEAKLKARAFDVKAAEDRRKNEARLAGEAGSDEDEDEDGAAQGQGQGQGQGPGKMIEEKDLGKAFDSDDMNFLNPTSMGAMDLKQPKMLTCQLKEYQLKGLNWLANLYEQGINGILADEMGLGKTVQSISLMAYLAEVHDIWGPFLVIAPASTLHNWQQEITRFVPALKALPYWGSVKDRQVLRKFWNRKQIAYNRDSPFHVLVTSYQLVVTDEAHFKRVNWQYMVLDEAQAIKSSQSARWKTLLSFNCRNRLLLTGTPVQNSMQELWALLHFIMPSLFDSHDEFSEWFSKDIESHAENKGSALNEHQLRRLHMILKPFMLRRIKKNVQNELGDKIEIDIFCEMSARQKMLYRNLRTAVSAQDIIEQAASNESGLKHLMNLVMQFRKVCNHPELFERADVSTPFAFAGSAQSGSIAREGDLLFLPDSTRSLIEMEVPKLFYEEGGFCDVPAQQSRAGFDTKYLDNLFNIWRADHIQRSLMQERDSPFAALPLLNLTAADAEQAYRNPTIERVLRAVEAERHWSEHEAFAADNEFAAAHLRPFGLVRKHVPRVRELAPSALLPLDGVSADYREHSVLAKPGARAIIPPVVAPPPELVASSRLIYDRQRGYARDGLVSLALYGLDADARESPSRIARVRSVLPGLPARGLLADSSEDQLPASSMQIPQMNKFIVDSSKLARLDALLRELKAGGHRCLIYFQMTRMIDLMEEYLIYRQYKYLRLDGASKISDRRDMVTDWQTNPELFVFLLSTRAGGLGINLTAADTVIFYDHDWNPSNDSQAMDRAHRLGQTKQVTVYRLITKGTIDERIVKLARNKKEVQDIVVGNKAYTESGMAKPQEIVSLLLDDDELAESILRRKQAEEAQTAEQKADMMRALHAKRRLLREKGSKEASPAPVQNSLMWTLDEDEDDFFGAKPGAPKADEDEETPEGTGTSTPVNKKKKSSGGATAGTKRKKPEPNGENGSASTAAKPRSRAKPKATKQAASAATGDANGGPTEGDAATAAAAEEGDDSLPATAPPKKRKKTDRRKKTADEIGMPPADD